MTDVGKEYGAALFMLACEAGQKKQYADALELLQEQFSRHAEYPAFLASPSIPLGERLSAIEQAFSAHLPTDVLSFLLLLCEKGRMECFSAAVKEYRALFYASEHIYEAKVTCATALTAREKEKLKKKLEAMHGGGEVRIEYVTDSTLLGGLIVEVDGKIIDGSLRRRLRDVKEVMNL